MQGPLVFSDCFSTVSNASFLSMFWSFCCTFTFCLKFWYFWFTSWYNVLIILLHFLTNALILLLHVLANFLILSCCTFWLKFVLVYSLTNVFILLKEWQQWPGSEPTHFLVDAFHTFAAHPVFSIDNLLLSPHHFAAVPEIIKRGKYKNLAHKLMWG